MKRSPEEWARRPREEVPGTGRRLSGPRQSRILVSQGLTAGRCAWGRAWDGADRGGATAASGPRIAADVTCHPDSPSGRKHFSSRLLAEPPTECPWLSVLWGSAHDALYKPACVLGSVLGTSSCRSKLQHGNRSMGLYSKLNGRWLKGFTESKEGWFQLVCTEFERAGIESEVGEEAFRAVQVRWWLELG